MNQEASPPTLTEVRVPDIGDFKHVAVIEVLVKPGDEVGQDQSVMTVESDKASIEIPSPAAGRVHALRVNVGDKVNQGDLILMLEQAGHSPERLVDIPDPVASARAEAASPAPEPAIKVEPLPPMSEVRVSENRTHHPGRFERGLPYASPSVRRLARQLGVPLEDVKGTGPNQRITPENVHDFVKSAMGGGVAGSANTAQTNQADSVFANMLPWPNIDFSKFGQIERKPLSRIQKISGANLHRNWVSIPHVTNHDECDVTELENFRLQLNKEHQHTGIKVTMLAFLVKAVTAALKQFPGFNASIDGDAVILKKYFHIGFAADTPNGLVVPVIRDADCKGILQISAEMAELAQAAREGKLTAAQMSGGCFSISSLGGIGGRYFTPIINAPEVAILGVCKSSWEPRWDGQQFVPRLSLPLSLSWDHRVIDGVAAARFNAYLSEVMSDFRRVLL